jgi:hypothetical protein
MMLSLDKLIKEAQMFGSTACDNGIHQWETDGGRSCPREGSHSTCSQPVFRCSACGEYDYGYSGGPGAEWCNGNNCPSDWMADAYKLGLIV